MKTTRIAIWGAIAAVLASAAVIGWPSSRPEDESEDWITIGDGPVCDSCTIELEHMARLGGEGDTTFVSFTNWLPQDGQGRFYFATPFARGDLLVFDSTGAFLAR